MKDSTDDRHWKQISEDTAIHPGHEDPISYHEALDRLDTIAARQVVHEKKNKLVRDPSSSAIRHALERLASEEHFPEVTPLIDTVGHISTHTVYSSCSTPRHATSAMDGFVINSSLTDMASPSHPITLRIVDVIPAGIDDTEQTNHLRNTSQANKDDGVCMEIMTGARCPVLTYPDLDAVVKLEDVKLVKKTGTDDAANIVWSIIISKPVRRRQNWRFAGSDLNTDQVVIWAGEVVKPKHIMGLAASGVNEIEVVSEKSKDRTLDLKPNLRCGVLSTGTELYDITNIKQERLPFKNQAMHRIPDSNGPYLTSALRYCRLAPDTEYLGVCKDSEEDLLRTIGASAELEDIDVLISSGGVSMGKFDLVRQVVETRLHGKIIFHGVRVRPGLPVLFALITVPFSSNRNGERTGNDRTIAFFGLPGNPMAAAAGFCFFVIPYLTILLYGCPERPLYKAKLVREQLPSTSPQLQCYLADTKNAATEIRRKPGHLTVFWLARRLRDDSLQEADDGKNADIDVQILEDQASYKVRNFLAADCWVVVPEEATNVDENETVSVSSLI